MTTKAITPSARFQPDDLDRAILSHADRLSALCPPGVFLNQADIARAIGINPSTVRKRIARLKKFGWWMYDHPGNEEFYTPSAEEFAKVIARSHRDVWQGMGDGRKEIDDPLIHGAGSTPSNGLPFPLLVVRLSGPCLAERVRRMVKDWKIRTGRMKARVRKEHFVHNERAADPYERRACRFGS